MCPRGSRRRALQPVQTLGAPAETMIAAPSSAGGIMNSRALLCGNDAFQLSTGSTLRITGFRGRREGLLSGPILTCTGRAIWTTELECESLPTSEHGVADAVDFFATELGAGSVVVLIGDRYGFSLNARDGRVIGRIETLFTGKESLDVFFAQPSPDGTMLLVASTRRIGVFEASGEVLADTVMPGLMSSCGWRDERTVEYQLTELEALEPQIISGTITVGAKLAGSGRES